jgi:hypothetical protein
VSSRFTIVNPCAKRWTDLHGEGRKRYCDSCKTPVHALAQYSANELNRLWRESGGHVCGFLSREPHRCSHGRRSVLLGLLLTAISPLLAQTGRVRIRVTDPTGAVVPNARAYLLGPNDKPSQTAEANEAGEIVFTDLPIGNSRFEVTEMGFRTLRLTATIRDSEEVKIEAPLDIGFVGEVVLVKKRSRWHWLIFR